MTEDTYVFVRKEEGGYVNDPSDSGGATKFGVTQSTYDLFRNAWKHELRPVRYITESEARKIYEDFFNTAHADKLPAGLDMMHFDFAINAGPFQAAKTLQKVLGVTSDGKIGPLTLQRVKELNTRDLILQYAEARRGFYTRLAEKRPKDAKFLKGWLKRVDRCESRSLTAHGPDFTSL